jgi:hypothetical protein
MNLRNEIFSFLSSKNEKSLTKLVKRFCTYALVSNSMKNLLVQHLELNEAILVQEWHAQFIRDLQRPDFDEDENGLKVIAQLYETLVQALKGKAERALLFEIFVANQEISEAKLPLLLAVLISGEEVLRDDLLVNRFGMHQFEPTVAGELFEIANRAFHRLMRDHAMKLCVNCFDLHSKTKGRGTESKRLSKQNRTVIYEPKY